MKAVILDGSRNGEQDLRRVRDVLVGELAGLGWQVEPITLHQLEIRHCLGCFGCWVQTPGTCLIDDAGRDVARAIIGSDLVVYFTPLTFGGYSSELKKAVDRSICLISPFFARIEGETHHKPRYERYPRLMGLAVAPQASAEGQKIFETLVGRNALNMHAPAHAAGVIGSSQDSGELGDRVRALLREVEVRA